jgi:UTP--glucose-1-phosphate uridylyltransferase
MKIRKAVIPAAGLGTRFLPATKTVPKELLPIVDKPTLLYNVEEIVAAGITELVIVAGRGKTAIEDFFDISYEVEDVLEKAGKSDILKSYRQLRDQITVISVRQHKALGLGHAVLCAEPVVGKEPFAVLLGDEIMVHPPNSNKPSGIAQLTRITEETGASAVAVIEVPKSEVSKYGIIEAEPKGQNLWTVKGVVEKPSIEQAPSQLALPGRYVFTADIFDILKKTKPGRGGEIQLSDAMNTLAKSKGLLATVIDARRFDAGDKLGFLKANVELALEHPELGKPFRQYLEERFGGAK